MALKIAYLERARLDLQKFRIYYETYFPEGMLNANERLVKCLKLLSHFPEMGRIAGRPPRRCFTVTATPYTILYQPAIDRLEIVRILDQRSDNYLQDLADQ